MMQSSKLAAVTVNSTFSKTKRRDLAKVFTEKSFDVEVDVGRNFPVGVGRRWIRMIQYISIVLTDLESSALE